MSLALIFGPPVIYGALSWAFRPAAVLATCAAPLAWAALGFSAALAYLPPGGTLPQLPLFVALLLAVVGAIGAFVGALALLTHDRRLATWIAFANALAWVAAFLLPAAS
jgi:hypothetical protein